MNIAVLSGKGGTGKTFVSVNLSTVAQNSYYIDCDVEEPNEHLFFKPSDVFTEDVCVLLPKIDKQKCTGCRKCVDFCKFNALAFIGKSPLIFKDICHSCGGCRTLCSANAIQGIEHSIGTIKTGKHKNITVISGILNTGEESGVPIIRKLLAKLGSSINVLDCPPGSACTVMESIKEADYCVIVAEPTAFGAHNFEMVHELVTLLNKPFGVIINKSILPDNPMDKLCEKNNLTVLKHIDYNKDLAALNAQGLIACEENTDIKMMFEEILQKINEEVLK